jgi:hypothetical protein
MPQTHATKKKCNARAFSALRSRRQFYTQKSDTKKAEKFAEISGNLEAGKKLSQANTVFRRVVLRRMAGTEQGDELTLPRGRSART